MEYTSVGPRSLVGEGGHILHFRSGRRRFDLWQLRRTTLPSFLRWRIEMKLRFFYLHCGSSAKIALIHIHTKTVKERYFWMPRDLCRCQPYGFDSYSLWQHVTSNNLNTST